MTANLLYALRWFVWLLRWMLSIAYGCLLQFVSKPGSRLIVPALAAPIAYSYRYPLVRLVLQAFAWHGATPGMLMAIGFALAVCVVVTVAPAWAWLRPAVKLMVLAALVLAVLQYTHWQGFDIAAYADAATVFIDTILALVFVLAACVYVALSRLLVLLLGAFPPAVRPLRPLRTLRVKNRTVRPVVVRMAVPNLPRRSRTPRVETLLPGAVK
jgi:hypothetical protein